MLSLHSDLLLVCCVFMANAVLFLCLCGLVSQGVSGCDLITTLPSPSVSLLPIHNSHLSHSQTTGGKALKDFKTTRERDDVRQALLNFISENPAVKVCGQSQQ